MRSEAIGDEHIQLPDGGRRSGQRLLDPAARRQLPAAVDATFAHRPVEAIDQRDEVAGKRRRHSMRDELPGERGGVPHDPPRRRHQQLIARGARQHELRGDCCCDAGQHAGGPCHQRQTCRECAAHALCAGRAGRHGGRRLDDVERREGVQGTGDGCKRVGRDAG
jgi:hypothetical protein